MTANAHELQELLGDIIDQGAVAEDRGINRLVPCEPLVERAQLLGVRTTQSLTLEELRAIIEAACASAE